MQSYYRWTLKLENGFAMIHDVALISATGSTRMGKAVSAAVGARLGKSLLELGGNNAIIISKEADLNMAIGWLFVWCSWNSGTKMYFHTSPDHS